MKARKFFGVLFTILGAMAIFLSLAVLILPLVANDQTRLVLDSFYQTSDHPLVNAINGMMSFMLENSFLTLALGAGVLLTGILFLLSAARYEEEQASKRRSAQRNTPPAQKKAPVWTSQKASDLHQSNPFAAPAAISSRAGSQPTAIPEEEKTTDDKPEAIFTEPVTLSEENASSTLTPFGVQETADPTPYQRPVELEEKPPAKPDDPVYSFGTARRVSTAAEATKEKLKPQQENSAVTPLFSTSFQPPVETPKAEPVPQPDPDPKPEVITTQTPPTQPRKIVIKSTMGKHTL